MTEYNASSIKIKSDSEVDDMFIWKKANTLADKYKTVSIESILVGLEACSLTDEPVENYKQRYLQGDKTVQVSEEFSECYMSLVREKRSKLMNR